jgi:hypothetical protein
MRDIIGYEGKYAVDSQGTVWSLNYLRTGKTRALKHFRHRDGYLMVSLSKDGKVKTKKIHRLVAEAYLDNYSDVLQVDHIDNVRTNNCVNNLRMVTSQQNHFNRTNTKGYYWNKKKKKWLAQIGINGKQHHLGYFVNEDDARQAYLDAKEKMHIFPT